MGGKQIRNLADAQKAMKSTVAAPAAINSLPEKGATAQDLDTLFPTIFVFPGKI